MTPWTDPHSPWKTQAAFMTWLRGMLRRGWMRYPPANTWKKSMSRPAPRGHRAKRLGDCSQCGKAFAISKLQVDHIIPAGGLQNADDIGPFVLRLFTTSDNIRLVCRPCHHTITQMERYGLTAGEAKIKAEVLKFTKLPPARQIITLNNHGCPRELTSNAAKRRKAYHDYLATGSFVQAGVPEGPRG